MRFPPMQRFGKRIVLYISDADLLTYDPLGACTGSFKHKYMGLQVVGHHQSI